MIFQNESNSKNILTSKYNNLNEGKSFVGIFGLKCQNRLANE